MIIDRRKDSYDELMMLSRDARLARNRKSNWTTAIIASAVVVSGMYVAGTNKHLGDLAQAKNVAENQLDTLRTQLATVTAERNFYKQGNEWLKEFANTLDRGDDVAKIVQNFPQTTTPAGGVSTDPVVQPVAANIVWLVDGSRRYPMKDDDLLWVPEAALWVTVNVDTSATPRRSRAFIHRGTSRPSPNSPGQEIFFPYEEKVTLNTSNCVRLTLHEDSIRPGFGGNYVDMEILYKLSDPGICGSNNRTSPP